MPVSLSLADSSGEGRRLVVRVTGALDADTARKIARTAGPHGSAAGGLVLDLAAVREVDDEALVECAQAVAAIADDLRSLRIYTRDDSMLGAFGETGLGQHVSLDRRAEIRAEEAA